MTTVLRDPASDAARAHRFMFVSDILQGFSDGIDGDRLNAMMEFGRDGRASDMDALLRAFEAPWLAAREEGGWRGNATNEARRDLARITAQAVNPLPGAGPMNERHAACLQKGDRLVGINFYAGKTCTFQRIDPDNDTLIWVISPKGLRRHPVWCFGYQGGPA